MPRIFLLFLIPLYAYKRITCKTQQRGKAEHLKKADLILHKTFTPTIKKYNLLPLESVRSRKCSWKITTASTSTPETSAEDAGTISSISCVVKMGQCQTLPRWGTAGKSLTCLLRPLNILGYVQIQDGKPFFFFSFPISSWEKEMLYNIRGDLAISDTVSPSHAPFAGQFSVERFVNALWQSQLNSTANFQTTPNSYL